MGKVLGVRNHCPQLMSIAIIGYTPVRSVLSGQFSNELSASTRQLLLVDDCNPDPGVIFL